MKVFFALDKVYISTLFWQEKWEQGLIVPFELKEGRLTNQCWIYQTCMLLKKAGTKCQLFHSLPRAGILIAQSNSLLPSYIPRKEIFFVDIVADGEPHPNAHLHIVQNRDQLELYSPALFMPHWPQPHLIKRDKMRGDRFEKVAFFGHAYNLDPFFHTAEWKNRLHEQLGIKFYIYDAESWHDYHDIDAVIALRDSSGKKHSNKPASKLYNAWLAGVPFIGGCDSAYAADGSPGKDYLVARTPEEVFVHLKELKENRAFRASLVGKGDLAGAAFTQTATLERWKELIQVTLPELAKK